MEYMKCKISKKCFSTGLEVNIGDNPIPQVTRLTYLRSILQRNGNIEKDVNREIQDRWKNGGMFQMRFVKERYLLS